MKKAALLVLIILLTAARAEAESDQRNVYDVYRGLQNPVAGATADEQTTALIKRHMANLLYPVELSSFAGPDKDENFRDLIKLLQAQMGAPTTGMLTFDQFGRLTEASRDIDERPVHLPLKKHVSIIDDGKMVWARGTGAADDLAYPINDASIECYKSENTCDLIVTDFDPKTRSLNRKHPAKAVMGDRQAAAAVISRSFQCQGSSSCSREAG